MCFSLLICRSEKRQDKFVLVSQVLNCVHAAALAFSSSGCFQSSEEKLRYYNVQITLGFLDFLARTVVVFALVLQISASDKCVQEDKRCALLIITLPEVLIVLIIKCFNR